MVMGEPFRLSCGDLRKCLLEDTSDPGSLESDHH
jgi:hypothetical protein